MNKHFSIKELPISGLYLIQRKRMADARGYLERLFCARELAEAGWHDPIVQINHTHTTRQGTVRGMHFQHSFHSEKKLVTCMKGQVYDVVVDIRKDSPTFLKWYAEILTPEASNSLLISEGFAHGFQSLTPEVEMLYCHSEFYAPDFEAGIHPNDPAIKIHWPHEILEMSDRDRAHPWINETFKGITV
jgi:dTDP-4-dehydrorhamnose 3,5-epimerase